MKIKNLTQLYFRLIFSLLVGLFFIFSQYNNVWIVLGAILTAYVISLRIPDNNFINIDLKAKSNNWESIIFGLLFGVIANVLVPVIYIIWISSGFRF